MNKKYGGYLTVEASLVLPIVFGCILLAVYLGIFQYDRCALEQKQNLITLLAVTEPAKTSEDRVRLAGQYAAGEENRYLAWTQKEQLFSVKKEKFRSEVSGEVRFPFRGLIPHQGSPVWEIYARSEGKVLHPVSFVRTYRKIMGGFKNADGIY